MKKILSTLLCLSLIISLSTNVFALVDRDKYKQNLNKEEIKESTSENTINLVTLGSSDSLGYGLPGFFSQRFVDWTGTAEEIVDWEANGWNAKTWNPRYSTLATTELCGCNPNGIDIVVSGAFPDLISKELESRGYNVYLSQLACASQRANDFCRLLYEDFFVDDYAYRYMDAPGMLFDKYGETATEGLNVLREKYQTALKNADIIAYDIGSGNMGGTWDASLEIDIGICYQNLLSEADYAVFIQFRNIINSKVEDLLISKGISVDSISLIEAFIDKFAYGLVGYCTCLDKSLDWIYSNNPDVCIVVMQVKNLGKDVIYYANDVEIPLGEIGNIVVSMANSYAASYSKYADKYYYARVTDEQSIPLIFEEFLVYQGPDNLSDTLRQTIDIYTMFCPDILLKSAFTPIYENAGCKVNDENYEVVLTSAYDAYIKLLQHINYSVSSIENCNIQDVLDLNEITKAMLGDLIDDFLQGKDNSNALAKACKTIDGLSPEKKRSLKYYIMSGITPSLHPSYKGYQQMADALFKALDTKQTGTKAVLKGIGNFVKDIAKTNSNIVEFYVDTIKTQIKDTIKSNIESAILEYKACTKKIVAGIKQYAK